MGLGPHWQCLFANDISAAKAQAYHAAFGSAGFSLGDIEALSASDLPGRADLCWASFPCQDLSLAGPRAGLEGARSGLFWAFWHLIEALDRQGRGPGIIALENVRGLLTSRGGKDFAALTHALAMSGRFVGAIELCASHFTPQSRPRLFIIAARHAPTELLEASPNAVWHAPAMRALVETLPESSKARWVWWRLAVPPRRTSVLADMLLDDQQDDLAWDSPAKSRHLLSLLAPRARDALDVRALAGGRHVGAVFRRTRRAEDGAMAQRCEVRFDGLAGCLRTPRGGSSRQAVVLIEGESIRSRLLHPRECARLMGVADTHPLPKRRGAALMLLGDGVAVPVVDWLQKNLLAPLARGQGPAPSQRAHEGLGQKLL